MGKVKNSQGHVLFKNPVPEVRNVDRNKRCRRCDRKAKVCLGSCAERS
jgi:DTW domain-containing protein YfiP